MISANKEFNRLYPSEAACAEALLAAKWPDGFVCSRCAHNRAYVTTTRKHPLYECAKCRYQASLIKGTVLEGTRTPLRKWFYAIFLASTPEGISATRLQLLIEVTYKTAWYMLTKIRHAISGVDDGERLSGDVRIGYALYGRPYTHMFIDHPQEHPTLIACSDDTDGQPARIKMKPVPKHHVFQRSPRPIGVRTFKETHIDLPNAVVTGVTTRYHPKRYRDLEAIANRGFKWINDTFCGIGPKYLKTYLDTFAFRFNRKFNKMATFQQLTELCATRPTTVIRPQRNMRYRAA